MSSSEYVLKGPLSLYYLANQGVLLKPAGDSIAAGETAGVEPAQDMLVCGLRVKAHKIRDRERYVLRSDLVIAVNGEAA